LCPCCKSTAETTNHLIRCQSCPQRASSVKAMKAAICPSDYHPARYVILAGILHWLDHEDSVPFNPSLSEYDPVFLPLLQDAIQSQACIGWGNALKGFLANLGERLPVTIFTTRDDWTLLMAKLDYDPSSMQPTSSRGQSGFQETLLFTIKQMLLLGTLAILTLRRSDTTTACHTFSLSTTSITVLDLWKNCSQALHQLAFDGCEW
jgi:hypothetical protein